MKVNETSLSGCLVIEPEVHNDFRGFFVETFQVERYAELAGINLSFVQDNHSYSEFSVLRGLHFQKICPQGRLVRAVSGEIFDVAVDMRRDSPTFGKWEAVVLSERNRKQVWVPPGFAHGFLVLSESANVEYKTTEYFDPDDEVQIRWNDPDLDIAWPLDKPILSIKDSQAPFLKDLKL